MNIKWLLLAVCALLVCGSVVGLIATRNQQAIYTRGWENATDTLDLPYRLPLAGVNVDLLHYDPDEIAAELDRIAAAGFTWVRQPFLWQDIEPEQGNYTWEAYDALVRAVDQHDSLQLVAVLDGTPRWARHVLAPEHPFAPPASVGDYARFAGAVAERYAGSITYYQIWDEPNIKSHWGNLDPRPAHYVAMLRESYTAIHAADGTASVIAAALAPTVETGPDNLSDLLFLQAIYDQGGQGYFDAAAGKPYGYSTGPYDRRVDSDILNFSRLILLREEMERRGDGKKPLWGSNFGWNYLPDEWAGPPSIWGSVSAAQQIEYTRDAYERAAREWPWVGGLIVQHWQPAVPADDPAQGFALAPVIDEWNGWNEVFTAPGLLPGLYPAQNAFTEYSDNWQLSELGADALIPDPDAVTEEMENRITVRFRGTHFALVTRRDDYIAYLYLTVDGKPANALPRDRDGDTFIILTSPERTPALDLIQVASGLDDDLHTGEIIHRPINGDDRWPIAGYAVASPPDTRRYTLAFVICGIVGGLALLAGTVTAARLPWRSIKPPSPQVFRRFGEWVSSIFVSLFVMVGTLLTWSEAIPSLLRRDPPALAVTIFTAGIAALSPVFVVTFVALAVLFVLIYNRLLLGAMLIIFWSAFFLSKQDLAFRVFSNVELYLIMTLAAVGLRTLVEWAKQRKTVIPRHRQWVALDSLAVAWVAIGVLSLSWSALLSYAVHDLRVLIIEPVLFYALLRVLRLDRDDLIWLADTLVLSGLGIAVTGLYLYFVNGHAVEAEGGAHRLIGLYGSPNGMGLYLGRCLPFAAAYALLPNSSWRRVFGAVAGGLILLALLLSQSRGAILLGLPLAFAMMTVFWHGRRALVPLAVLVVVTVLAMVLLSFVLPRLSDLTGNTAFFRAHLWYSSLNLIRERPLTGAGLDQFLYLYRSRYLLPEAWAEPNLSIPHTILLNHWVNLGLLGVLTGIGFQIVFWRLLWRVRGRVKTDPLFLAIVLGLAGSMGDFLGHGLVDVAYFSINLSFVFFLSLALLVRLSLYTGPLDQKKVW